MESIVLKAIERTGTRKKAAKQVRSEGQIPGVVYGNEHNILVSLSANELEHLVSHGGSHSIINLDLEGSKKKQNVVLKEIQRNPRKGNIQHVDFLLIDLKQEIEQTVPVTILGEEVSAGIRAGGIIQNMTREVVIKGMAKDLPDHIDADISDLEIGSQIRVSDLVAPDGIQILNSPDEGIIAIVTPAKPKEEEIVAEAVEPEEVAKGGEAEKQESGS